MLHNANYKAEPLPNIAREDLDAGKELIDVGACCPTIFTTGRLVNFLKKEVALHGKEETAKKYMYLTAGSCGPCRFGQYHESYAMALDGLGFRDFRIFLMAQDELDQSEADDSGFVVNASVDARSWCGQSLCADVDRRSRNTRLARTRFIPGQTDAVLKDSIEFMYTVFKNRPNHGEMLGRSCLAPRTTSYFTKALREVRKKWKAIEVDRIRVKARVKITGEFWLQTHEGDGNYNIKRWLEQEDSEVVPPPCRGLAALPDASDDPQAGEAQRGQQTSQAR